MSNGTAAWVILKDPAGAISTNPVTGGSGGGSFSGDVNQFGASGGQTHIITGAQLTNLFTWIASVVTNTGGSITESNSSVSFRDGSGTLGDFIFFDTGQAKLGLGKVLISPQGIFTLAAGGGMNGGNLGATNFSLLQATSFVGGSTAVPATVSFGDGAGKSNVVTVSAMAASMTNVLPVVAATGLMYGTNNAGIVMWTNVPNGTSGQVLTANANGMPVWAAASGTVSPTTLVQTNFVPNTVYANGSQTALLKAGTALTTAAVNGDASLDLMVDQAGGSSFSLLSRNGVGTTVAVTLAMTYTNTIAGIVAPSATYYFTNSSSGAGNVASIVPGTGQIGTIASGTNGATGPTGPAGSGGVSSTSLGFEIFYEPFGTGSKASSGTLGNLGWNVSLAGAGVSVGPAAVAGHFGVHTISSSTSSAGGACGLTLSDSSSTSVSPLPPLNATVGWTNTFVWRLTATNDVRIYLGLAGEGVSVGSAQNDPVNFMGMKFDSTNDTHFQQVCRAASASTVQNDIANDTAWHTNRIWSTVNGTISFNIDNGAAFTSSANVPSVNLTPFILLSRNLGAGATAPTLNIDEYLGIFTRQ